MKIFLGVLIALITSLNLYFLAHGGDILSSTNEVKDDGIKWDIGIYENAKELEFVLNIDGSLLLENLKRDESRIRSGDDGVLNIKNVSKSEEKIAMKIKNNNGDSIIFTNFETKKYYPGIKKFHQIDLIEFESKIKARVRIYVHKEIDFDIANLLLGEDSFGRTIDSSHFDHKTAQLDLATVSYIFVGMTNNARGRVVKIK